MGFLEVRWLDVIDVLITAFLLYKVYDLLKGTVAINIFLGIIAIYILWWLCSRVLDMKLLGGILGQFIGVGVLALIIVFQQEVRRFLILLGSKNIFKNSRIARRFFIKGFQFDSESKTDLKPILKACTSMSKTKTGAIMVIERKTDLNFYAETGDVLNADLSKRAIESIFFKNSPLHDGAIIISGNKIKAARCVLPVTDNTELPAQYGMRHRAALGITEQSDAVAIIVSEETGAISVAVDGKIQTNIDPEDLEQHLHEIL
ncbi:MAG: TIGR00159 family protein [Bacteroidia bacterium]|nr:TIGR00159 family protein [Bacteroidia bacterium]